MKLATSLLRNVDNLIINFGLFLIGITIKNELCIRVINRINSRRIMSRFINKFKNIWLDENFQSDKSFYRSFNIRKSLLMVEVKTSGTTGEPFKFLRSKFERKLEQIFMLRTMYLRGYRAKDPILWLRSYVPNDGEDVITFFPRKNHWMCSAYHMTADNMDSYITLIRKENIRNIFAYPSSIFILSEYLIKSGDAVSGIDTIVVSSEILHDSWRQTIEAAFPEAELIDVYNNVEATALLTSCRVCGGYHINSDYGKVEFIKLKDDFNGLYEIVGTGFLNNAYPFYRYNSGDIFKLISRGVSKCDRADEIVVGKILGRRSDIITLKDKAIPLVNFYTVMYGFADQISQFQLVQFSAESFDLRYIGSLDVQSESELRKQLLLRLGPDSVVSLSRITEIDRDPTTGKIRPFIRLND